MHGAQTHLRGVDSAGMASGVGGRRRAAREGAADLMVSRASDVKSSIVRTTRAPPLHEEWLQGNVATRDRAGQIGHARYVSGDVRHTGSVGGALPVCRLHGAGVSDVHGPRTYTRPQRASRQRMRVRRRRAHPRQGREEKGFGMYPSFRTRRVSGDAAFPTRLTCASARAFPLAPRHERRCTAREYMNAAHVPCEVRRAHERAHAIPRHRCEEARAQDGAHHERERRERGDDR